MTSPYTPTDPISTNPTTGAVNPPPQTDAAAQGAPASGQTKVDNNGNPVPIGSGTNYQEGIGSPPPTGGSSGTTPPLGTQMTYDANGNPVTDSDALSIIETELQSWGFGQDAIDWATSQIQSNDSVDQIIYSLRSQPFYVNSIFGQVASARLAAGLPAMTEADILSYQDYAVGVAQQAGLPPGFINTNELVALMGNDVSTAELDARITTGLTAALKAPPSVLQEFQDYYGIGPGGLAAYYLNPTTALPLLQNQFTAAQIGNQAQTTGWGSLTAAQAMQLAQQGTTESTAQTSFTKLANEQQIMNALPGEGRGDIAPGVQLAAEFQGNETAQREINVATEQREAVFQGNYHYAETPSRGITGLGAVNRNGGSPNGQ